jgi:hypothetical protein
MHIRLLWLALPLLCAACGCRNTGEPKTTPMTTAVKRIIIGFDETAGAGSSATELTTKLGKELGCELRPLQTLGGNAYVYNCVTGDTEEVLTRKLNGLGRHQGVRYAELDRIHKIQN